MLVQQHTPTLLLTDLSSNAREMNSRAGGGIFAGTDPHVSADRRLEQNRTLVGPCEDALHAISVKIIGTCGRIPTVRGNLT